MLYNNSTKVDKFDGDFASKYFYRHWDLNPRPSNPVVFHHRPSLQAYSSGLNYWLLASNQYSKTYQPLLYPLFQSPGIKPSA